MTNHLSFISHFAELRKRVIISVLTYLLAFITCYYFSDYIYQALVYPLFTVMQNHEISTNRMIYTSLAEGFLTNIKVSLITAIPISFPFICTQMWLFIAPALYKKERLWAVLFLLLSPCLFLLGALIAYSTVIPMAWNFFLQFQSNLNMAIQLEAKISEYLDLCTSFILAFGLSFQLPLIMVLLTKLSLVSRDLLKRKRKHALIITFIIGAIFTPPDVISQIILATLLYLLYELSIIIIWIMNKK